jgi:hypothetical protein
MRDARRGTAQTAVSRDLAGLRVLPQGYGGEDALWHEKFCSTRPRLHCVAARVLLPSTRRHISRAGVGGVAPMTALRRREDETWLADLNEYGLAKFEEDYADQESAVGRNGRRAFAAGWTTMAVRSKLWSYFNEPGRARREGPPAKAVTERSRLEKSAAPALSFPHLTKLRAYPFLKAEDVPKVPQIYAMVSLKDHAARVGSCADNGQFRKHATPGWLEDMHRENRRNANVAANLNRRIKWAVAQRPGRVKGVPQLIPQFRRHDAGLSGTKRRWLSSNGSPRQATAHLILPGRQGVRGSNPRCSTNKLSSKDPPQGGFLMPAPAGVLKKALNQSASTSTAAIDTRRHCQAVGKGFAERAPRRPRKAAAALRRGLVLGISGRAGLHGAAPLGSRPVRTAPRSRGQAAA